MKKERSDGSQIMAQAIGGMMLSFSHSRAEECEVFIGRLRIFWRGILSQCSTCNPTLAESLNTS